MKKNTGITEEYSKSQLSVLVILRVFVGWHLLYEGITKVLNPYWSSAEFLMESKWILSGLSDWIVSNPGVLSVVDFLNEWGLIAIGFGLIAGLFTRTAAYAGTILLLLYYANIPPLIGLEYSMPAEGNYLIINKTLIESVALLVLALFPTGHLIGMDLFIKKVVEVKDL